MGMFTIYCMYRHNQALEQDSAAMQEEQARLTQEAHNLSQRMEALMHDKFELHDSKFDAETPIDKVLNVMQAFITQVRVNIHPVFHACSKSCVTDGWLTRSLPPSLTSSLAHLLAHALTCMKLIMDILSTQQF